MKVILMEDVARLGQKYDVKDVPQGHALNFLIPKKLAQPATKKSLERIEAMREQQASSVEADAAAFKAALERLPSEQVTLAAPANEQGHLYEGVNVRDIASQLAALDMPISESDIKLDEPIKTTGEHTVALVRGEAQGSFTLTVVAK